MKSKLMPVLFAFILLSVTLIAAELVCRSFYAELTTPAGRWTTALALSKKFNAYKDADLLPQAPRLIPHPYFLFTGTPNLTNSLGKQHNSMGLRQTTEVVTPKPAGTLRVLALGGSTTYGASVAVPADTWPMQLHALYTDADKATSGQLNTLQIEVINGGIDSAASAEILSAWNMRYRFMQPDVVILNLGINDIWPVLLSSQYDSEYTEFRKANVVRPAAGLYRHLLESLFLFRTLHAFLNSEDASSFPFEQVRETDIYDLEAQSQGVSARVRASDAIGFKRNLEQLIRVIRLDSAKVLLVMEPSLTVTQLRLKIPNKAAPFGWILGLEEAWMIGQQKNYGIMQEIARQYKIPFFWMSANDFKTEWFTDWYHLTSEGEALKAKQISQALKSNGLINYEGLSFRGNVHKVKGRHGNG